MLDYERSIAKLTERVGLMHRANWSPTPEAKALEELANKLDETIALMDRDTYWDLEECFNRPTRGFVRLDGSREPDIDRAGSYAGIRWRLSELAGFARSKKNELPRPNKKHELPFAAMAILHIMYQSGKERPTLYNKSQAVKELGRVCEGANIILSPERLRGALAAALESFDPNYMDAGVDEILVFAQ